jgi:hypothetical protein
MCWWGSFDTGGTQERVLAPLCAGTGIALMQLGVAFELETPKLIVGQILMKR